MDIGGLIIILKQTISSVLLSVFDIRLFNNHIANAIIFLQYIFSISV